VLMNGYVLFVLGALALTFAITGLARWLNVRSLSVELPEEFAGVFDPAEYVKSQEYLRARARLEWVGEGFDLIAASVFVFAGGMGWLDSGVRSLGFGEIPTGLVFIGALALAQGVLALPFDVYGTFIIEARFGFNTTTPKVFVTDRIKGVALGTVLGGGLLWAVLYAYSSLGQLAWLTSWLVITTVMAIMLLIAPVWILPLFNRFTPLADGELRRAIEAYALSQGFHLAGVFVMDGSKRSTKANAFFTGLGRNKRISLYDTLIDRMSTEEVVAVLAHEVGHSKLGHIGKGFMLATAKMGLVLFVLQLFLGSVGLQEAFGVAAASPHVGLALFGLAYQPLALLLGVLANAVSRRFEFQADAYGVAGTGGPGALVSALKTLSLANLSNLTPHPLMVWLQYSHPPVLERIRRLMSLSV
jgi:STE24 endopeptidase